MRLIDKLLATTIIFSSVSCFAYEEADYYENEGDLLFKIRGTFSHSKADLQEKPTNKDEPKPKNILGMGYGIDTATTIFFNSHFAAELSLGMQYYKIKSSELNKAAAAYGGKKPSVNKKKNEVYHIPLTATIQYHTAPYGGIRPYMGVGYHGAYNYTRSKNFRTTGSHGAVLQLGVDFVSMEDKIFTLDVKQYFSKSKIEFDKKYLGKSNAVSSKIKWNPLVISAGIGFKF